jgi:hypothetical protein
MILRINFNPNAYFGLKLIVDHEVVIYHYNLSFYIHDSVGVEQYMF